MLTTNLSSIKIAHYQVWSTMDAETFSQLVNDVKKNGIIYPLIVDESLTLLDGHHRYKAAQEAKLETVPIVIKKDLTEDEKLEIAYKANSTTRTITKAEKQAKARELYEQGRSYRQIAKWLGVGKSTVQRWVQGVPNGTVHVKPKVSEKDTQTTNDSLDKEIRRLKRKIETLERQLYYKDEEIKRIKKRLEEEQLRNIGNIFGTDNGLKVFAVFAGLDENASPQEIKRALRKARGKAHPDISGNDWVSVRYNLAADMFKQLYPC